MTCAARGEARRERLSCKLRATALRLLPFCALLACSETYTFSSRRTAHACNLTRLIKTWDGSGRSLRRLCLHDSPHNNARGAYMRICWRQIACCAPRSKGKAKGGREKREKGGGAGGRAARPRSTKADFILITEGTTRDAPCINTVALFVSIYETTREASQAAGAENERTRKREGKGGAACSFLPLSFFSFFLFVATTSIGFVHVEAQGRLGTDLHACSFKATKAGREKEGEEEGEEEGERNVRSVMSGDQMTIPEPQFSPRRCCLAQHTALLAASQTPGRPGNESTSQTTNDDHDRSSFNQWRPSESER